ncbi:MAG: thioredoxin family protein [Planctomycetaceae bacterium]|nr:thioredoxin family protein [Planctomycetaceae bacterium]
MSPACAGEFNQKLNIGDQAPNFQKLPGTDGKAYSLEDFKQARAMVLVFTCNSCPYAVDYEERLSTLTRRLAAAVAKGTRDREVAVVAINCNLVEADSLEEMRKRATEQQFPFHYLFDESQQTGKQYGALRTPEFFVLDAERRVVYMGAFDDNTDASKVTREHVALAVQAVLDGKPIEVAETPPIGCLIRYKRERGGR